jgi:ABC-type uncharacterized transport system auxiliary subunit
MIRGCFLALVILLAACTFAPRDTGSGFLFALSPASVPAKATRSESLIVATPAATAELDTARIALKREDRRWDYYLSARWSDFLPVVVRNNVAKTLQQSGLFTRVATDESGISGDRILKTDIQSFQAEYAGSGAPVIKIRMVSSLVTRLERHPLASFEVAAQKRAKSNTLSDIQSAFAAAFIDAQRQLVVKMEKQQ